MTGHGPSSPPRLAVALLCLTMPAGLTRESVLGDLAEEFARRDSRSGPRARVWYWRTALQVAGAYLWDTARSTPREIMRDARFAARRERASAPGRPPHSGARSLPHRSGANGMPRRA